MEEVWKDVVGYEGLYQVSNLGRVKSLKRNQLLKPKIAKNGYVQVKLYNGDKKTRYIHRLVANAFLDNHNGKAEVNHIDSNPSNNRLDNLEWVTHKENMEWSALQGTMIRAKICKRRPIIGTDENGKMYIFEKLRDVEKFGFDRKNVSMCCNGKYKQHKGLTWKYAIVDDRLFD